MDTERVVRQCRCASEPVIAFWYTSDYPAVSSVILTTQDRHATVLPPPVHNEDSPPKSEDHGPDQRCPHESCWNHLYGVSHPRVQDGTEQENQGWPMTE